MLLRQLLFLDELTLVQDVSQLSTGFFDDFRLEMVANAMDMV